MTPKALVFLYEWKREKISIETKSSFFFFVCVFLLDFSFMKIKEEKGKKEEKEK